MNSGRKGMLRSCSVTGHRAGKNGEEEEAEQPQAASAGSRPRGDGEIKAPTPPSPAHLARRSPLRAPWGRRT